MHLRVYQRQSAEGSKKLDSKRTKELQYSKTVIEAVEDELDKQINELESQVSLKWERIKEYEKSPKLQFRKPPKAKVSTSSRSDECEIGSSSNSDWTKSHKQSTPRVKSSQSEICADLWKQLRRVTIPVFNGEKSNYESWKAAFMACIGKAPATPEYNLLQLRQCMSGEALRTIQNLGHSAATYEVAKARLERKFGGQRRKVALHLEQIERIKPIRRPANMANYTLMAFCVTSKQQV